MNNVNYDASRNEVTITGCVDCPFSFSTPRAEAQCNLKPELNWIGLPESIPMKCPLRDPNFKLIRVLK